MTAVDSPSRPARPAGPHGRPVPGPRRPAPLVPGALTAAPVLGYMDRFAFLPLLSPAAADLHVTVHAVTVAVSAYFLLYGLAQPVIGSLSDRYSRRIVLRTALAVLAVADLAAAAAPGPAWLIASRAVAGAASGALLPTALVFVGDVVDFRVRQRAVAQVLSAAAFGAGVAMLLAGLFAQWSWRLPLVVCALLAPLVRHRLRGLPEPPRANARPSIGHILRRNPLLLALLAFGLLDGAAVLGMWTFFAPALHNHGASSLVTGTVMSVYGMATLAGAQLLRRLPTALVPRVPLVAGGAAMIAGYAAVATTTSPASVLTASALLGLSFTLFHSTFQTWATELLPAARGVVTSLFAGSVFTGAAATTVAAAPLAAEDAFPTLFTTAAALSTAVAVLGTAARLTLPRNRPPT